MSPRALIDKLTHYLERCQADLEEAACTCVDRSEGHQRGCVGVSMAKEYNAAIRQGNKYLSEKN